VHSFREPRSHLLSCASITNDRNSELDPRLRGDDNLPEQTPFRDLSHTTGSAGDLDLTALDTLRRQSRNQVPSPGGRGLG